MFERLRNNVLAWTTSGALTLTMAQAVAPTFMDWILDFLVVGLVALAAKLARAS